MKKRIKWSRFSKWSSIEYRYWLKGLGLSIWYLIAIKILSFKTIAQNKKNSSIVTNSISTELLIKTLGRVERTAPWPVTCLSIALVARNLFRSQGLDLTIHLGVSKQKTDTLAAHAWTISNEHIITGGGNLQNYTELFTFE